MKTTTEKICRTILPEQGELHCTVGEERYLLAKCDYPKIEVIEQVERIITGGHEARITSFYFSIMSPGTVLIGNFLTANYT